MVLAKRRPFARGREAKKGMCGEEEWFQVFL
jgi:hypothetical protein